MKCRTFGNDNNGCNCIVMMMGLVVEKCVGQISKSYLSMYLSISMWITYYDNDRWAEERRGLRNRAVVWEFGAYSLARKKFGGWQCQEEFKKILFFYFLNKIKIYLLKNDDGIHLNKKKKKERRRIKASRRVRKRNDYLSYVYVCMCVCVCSTRMRAGECIMTNV